MQWVGDSEINDQWVGDDRIDNDPQWLGLSGLSIVNAIPVFTFRTINTTYLFETVDK